MNHLLSERHGDISLIAVISWAMMPSPIGSPLRHLITPGAGFIVRTDLHAPLLHRISAGCRLLARDAHIPMQAADNCSIARIRAMLALGQGHGRPSSDVTFPIFFIAEHIDQLARCATGIAKGHPVHNFLQPGHARYWRGKVLAQIVRSRVTAPSAFPEIVQWRLWQVTTCPLPEWQALHRVQASTPRALRPRQPCTAGVRSVRCGGCSFFEQYSLAPKLLDVSTLVIRGRDHRCLVGDDDTKQKVSWLQPR